MGGLGGMVGSSKCNNIAIGQTSSIVDLPSCWSLLPSSSDVELSVVSLTTVSLKNLDIYTNLDTIFTLCSTRYDDIDNLEPLKYFLNWNDVYWFNQYSLSLNWLTVYLYPKCSRYYFYFWRTVDSFFDRNIWTYITTFQFTLSIVRNISVTAIRVQVRSKGGNN